MELASNRSATRFEQVRAISTCRDSSNLLEVEPGSRPVRSWSKQVPCELDDRPNSSSLQVCDQLRTCLRRG